MGLCDGGDRFIAQQLFCVASPAEGIPALYYDAQVLDIGDHIRGVSLFDLGDSNPPAALK